jgi:hypothetical protein
VIEPKFDYELRGEVALPEGLEVALRPGIELTIKYWLGQVNDKKLTHLQRVSALIVLFQLGVNVRIEAADG